MTSEALRPADVGHVLAGRYRLVDLVRGADASGASLWQAVDEVLGRRVAVHLHEPGGRHARHLLSAATLAGRVNHPGLANVFDAGDAMTYAYVISEWVDGIPLSNQLLRDGALNEQTAVRVLTEVSAAIAEAHRCGVVHGRLKADRVLLTDSGARVTGIGFAPPDTTEHDDLLSLGGLLYAMITGYWPLSGPTVLPHIDPRAGRLPSPRSVLATAPADLEEVASRLLESPSHAVPGPRTEGPTPRGPVSVTSVAALESLLRTWPWTTPSQPPPRNFWRRRLMLIAFLTSAALLGWGIGTVIGTVPAKEGVLTRSSPQSTHSPSATPTATSSTPTPSASAPAPAAPVAVPISSAVAFDPQGDQHEHNQAVPLAYDGDPATAWYTEGYLNSPAMAGIKEGVGIAVDLGRPANVRQIHLVLATPGISLQLRASDAPGTSITDYSLVAQSTEAAQDVVLTLPASVVAQDWVVWVTRLVPNGTAGGGVYHAGIAEMTFLE